ncbi:phage tail protein [Xenorhabdus ishibashii]|uniref:Phage tail protein n=1 Tax=Xenorhabdus ishibashii TaxID=1034471 RepID=A0A2D0KA72_9GAMM|nr:phage tail protein [Xenorhabdus ishibashii]PHM60359.1 phage tail protein [Xenorhabdus ishibashii]
MTTSTEQIANQYPLPNYRFLVSFGSEKIAFNNISGLEINHDVIEYKDGIGNYFKMPGQRHAVNITLRKGIFPKDTHLFTWMSSIQLNQVEKKDILISLTDDTGQKILMSWSVTNAFPTKLTIPSFDATSNEIAVEEISLTADMIKAHAP